MMLLFYGLLAGLLLVRLPQFGSNYLYQPRYVMICQLDLLALILVGLDWLPVAPSERDRGLPRLAIISALFIALLVLQCCLSVDTWGLVRYQSDFYRRMAAQIGEAGRNPNGVVQKCTPSLTLCQMAPERRKYLVEMLKRHRLNLYSPTLQRVHRLFPGGGVPSGD